MLDGSVNGCLNDFTFSYLDGTGEQVGELGFKPQSPWPPRELLSTPPVALFWTVEVLRGGEGEPDPPDNKQEIPERNNINLEIKMVLYIFLAHAGSYPQLILGCSTIFYIIS